jgi:hypothetical protein
VAYIDDFINKHFVFDTVAVVPGSTASTPVAPAATLVSSEVK